MLIDYLRDQPQAVAFLESTEQPLATSVITVSELYAGVRDGEERLQMHDHSSGRLPDLAANLD